MKSNRPLYIIFGLLAILTLCVCAASATLIGYFAARDISTVFQNPSSLFEGQITQIPPAVETQIPLGDEVDLQNLFTPVWESRQHLQEEFVEQPVDEAKLGQGALDGLKQFLEGYGVNLDHLQAGADAPSAASLSEQAGTPQEAASSFEPFWEAWRNVQYGSLGIVTTYEDLMRASLRGMVDALGDPNTLYLDPFQLQQAELSLEGEYEGIGAWVDTTTEYVTIIAPMEGSPAEEAGLMPGDLVLAVDGQDMTGVPGDVAISHILGPAGSTVVLTIQREGEPKPFDVSIVREHIVVPSVQSEMLDNNIAYVQFFTFGSESDEELHAALEDLLAKNPSGLILDLRNNGGGYVDTAIAATSEFIKDGVIFYEEYGDGSRETYETLSDGIATDIPMVVLVNQGSASASEILAGAVQDYERALLVGETTFGKGSVQITLPLSNGQGALHVTIANWLTPLERLIHGVGLVPDVVVALTEEDAQAGLDPQLEKAIEVLSTEISGN